MINELSINCSKYKRRNKSLLKTIFKIYLSNLLTTSSIDKMKKEMGKHTVSYKTFKHYIEILSKLFILNEIKGYSFSFLYKSQYYASSLKNVIEPSLILAGLNLTYYDLKKKENKYLFKVLFNSLCYKELTIISYRLNGSIYYFKHKNDLFIDCILELPNKKYGLISFAYDNKSLSNSIYNLKRFDELLAKHKNKLKKKDYPIFKLILTSEGSSFIHSSGIYIAPITCLAI